MTITRYGKKSKLSTMKKFKEIKKRKPKATARYLNSSVLQFIITLKNCK
jgi:hypothetical protein